MRTHFAPTPRVVALLASMAALGLLASCTIPLPSARTPRADEAATTPTAVQPSAEPTPVGPAVSFGGVSFLLDPAIAAAASGAIMPDTSDPSTPPEYDKGPARLAFSFDGYTGPTHTIPALVFVYDVADLAGKPEEQIAANLATLLQERPDLAKEPQVPFLPFMNAGQVMHARNAYLDFSNGAGVRALTSYAQDASPLTADRIWYTFQGLTSDGQAYVAATFPLRTDLFPQELPADFDYDEWFAGYDQALADTIQALADAPADRFVPELDKLDALVRSIVATPDETATVSPTTPAGAASTGFVGTYAATLPSADTPGRALSLALNPDNTAAMSTDYLNGAPPIVETGTWQDNGDGTATVTFTQVDDNLLATPDVITFAQEDDLLVAVAFDREAYGMQDIRLQKAGDGAEVMPTQVAASEPLTQAVPAEPTAPAEPALPNTLTGITWQLQQITRQNAAAMPVADPSKVTITFNADGTAAVVADCNTGSGPYQVDGSAIRVQVAATRKTCPPPTFGAQFVKYLEYVDSYEIENGTLLLSSANGSTTLSFAPAGQ